MPDASDDLALPDTLRELRDTYGVDATYPRFWSLVVNGNVPAHRVGRRWHTKRGNLPLIAQVLGGRPRAA